MKSIISLLVLFLSIQAFAVEVAVVKSVRAIVYSDQALTSPIGYIRSGRKIQVGTPHQKDALIVPIVVSGKIAYIQLKDITFKEIEGFGTRAERVQVTEHDVDQILFSDDKKLTQFVHLTFTMNSLTAGAGWDELSQSFGDSVSNASSYILSFQYRPPGKKWSWDVGLGLYSLSQSSLTFQTLTLEGNIYYRLMKLGILEVHGHGGILLSGDAEVEARTDTEKNAGALFGTNIGIQARLFPYSTYSLIAGVSIKRLNLHNLNPITLNNGDGLELNGLSGTNFYAGIGYEF